MSDPFSLKDKVFLVTGGTRGIGRAISTQFARSGAMIIANHNKREESAKTLLALADQENLSIDVCRADVTTDKGRSRIKEKIDAIEGGLSGVVHAAATGIHMPFEQLTKRHFDWVLSLNTIAFFELVKLLIPHMQPGAAMLAISSKGAVRAVEAYTTVGTSKGALEALSRHLAVELADRAIRVNVLAPGSVETDSWEVIPNKEERLAQTIRKTPLKRLVTVEEVACAAQFLCSPAASGITGQTINVDGGVGIVE